ncbi:MAG: NUDIX hydrolase [Angelakisella sp.]
MAGRLEPLAALYPTPAYCDEKIWIFTAKDLTPGHTHPDEDEFITAEWVPLARAEQMVLAGEIEDAKTQIAILKYTALRRKGELHE